MGASLLVSVFLAFSLSLSWFSGDKEKGILEDTIQETVAKQKAINEEYLLLTVKMREKDASRKVLEAKLKRELKKQQKLKRSLAMEKRKLRIAVESGKAVDIETEREKIRKEVEDRASKEIAKLEEKIATIEAEKKQLEENARAGLMARQDKNSDAYTQAELAKARAREAIMKYKALKSELENLRAAKDKAENILREQARARKNAEEALAKEKTNRAALEARLKAVEKVLKISTHPGSDKKMQDAATALMAELERARKMLHREMDKENRTISQMEKGVKKPEQSVKNVNVDDKEKEILRSKLEEKVRKIAKLERELRVSRTREQALRANIDNRTTAERAGDSLESDRIDALRARIQNLEAKLQATEEKKKAFAEQAKARIEALRKRTEQLETRKIDTKNGIEEGQPLRTKTSPPENLGPQLTNTNTPQVADGELEIQTKLLGKDLIDLQAKASNYVAQKMIDRNIELEAQLQETRLQLAEARSAYRNARSDNFMDNNGDYAPASRDTRAIIARYRKAATTITALNQRNIQLEAKATLTERVMAEAEASRFIIEKLQAQNLELLKRLQELEAGQKAKTSEVPPVAEKNTKALNIAKKTPQNEKPAPALKKAAQVKADPSSRAAGVETIPLMTARASSETANDMFPLVPAKTELAPSSARPLVVVADIKPALKPRTTGTSKAERASQARELRDIVNSIQDLNAALEDLAKNGPGPDRPTLAEIHENVRKLRKRIVRDVEKGVLSMEDIIPYTNDGGEFTFYLLKKGETPDEIARKQDVYGDAALWPLIYRYNQSRLDRPDIINTSRLLIIYKDLPANEKQDAMKKAKALGQWAQWSEKDKRAWIEDWIM